MPNLTSFRVRFSLFLTGRRPQNKRCNWKRILAVSPAVTAVLLNVGVVGLLAGQKLPNSLSPLFWQNKLHTKTQFSRTPPRIADVIFDVTVDPKGISSVHNSSNKFILGQSIGRTFAFGNDFDDDWSVSTGSDRRHYHEIGNHGVVWIFQEANLWPRRNEEPSATL